MLRGSRETVRLRLRQGQNLPLDLVNSPLIRELYLSRYLRYSQAGWRCSLCGGRVQATHMTVHTCLTTALPAWSKSEMQQGGLLSDSGDRCRLCAKAVGSGAPHTCRSPLVRTFTADLSAVVEPWRGLDQAAYAPLRRLQGQVLVVMPEEAYMQQPQRALDAGSFMMFQGVVAMSRVVAAGQQMQQAEQPADSDSSGDEPLRGRGLGLYSLLGLQAPSQAAAAAAVAQPGRDGCPRLQQTWVCPYTGQLQEHVNQASESLSTMRVWDGRATKSVAVEPAREGGVAVLVNCGHGTHANAEAATVWRPDLGYWIPYICAQQDAPPGCEVLYDYDAVTDDADEYRSLHLNPACGCGCGGRLLKYQEP